MLIQDLMEAIKKVEGTNCDNCSHANHKKTETVDPKELNANGGLRSPDKKYEDMAKSVDLVTLPGKDTTVKTKFWCGANEVNNWVTKRMCCALWDSVGTKRGYKGTSPITK